MQWISIHPNNAEGLRKIERVKGFSSQIHLVSKYGHSQRLSADGDCKQTLRRILFCGPKTLVTNIWYPGSGEQLRCDPHPSVVSIYSAGLRCAGHCDGVKPGLYIISCREASHVTIAA